MLTLSKAFKDFMNKTQKKQQDNSKIAVEDICLIPDTYFSSSLCYSNYYSIPMSVNWSNAKTIAPFACGVSPETETKIQEPIVKYNIETALYISPQLPHFANLKGMLAVRNWNISDTGKLKSTYVEHIWQSNSIIADVSPEIDKDHGIYGISLSPIGLTDNRWHSNPVVGFVDMFGKVIEHDDGVIRAEMCNILKAYYIIDSEENERFVSFAAYSMYNAHGIPVSYMEKTLEFSSRLQKYCKDIAAIKENYPCIDIEPITKADWIKMVFQKMIEKNVIINGKYSVIMK